MNTPIVTAEWLAAHLDEVLVFDCRFSLADPGSGARAYAEAHIPGAQYVHLDADLSGLKTGQNGRHPLPEKDAFIATLSRLGIAPQSKVVVYDDAGGMFAARFWWMLRWAGFDAVAVLDGGWPYWIAQGQPTSASLPKIAPGQFVARWRDECKVSADFVLAHLDDAAVQILDARTAERFRGENETLDPVGGHIPGAANRFYQLNLQADGRFKSPEALRAEWAAMASPEKLVHQCGSGVTACHNVLAMEYAGLTGSRLYAGSWSEWCADPARPVAR